MNGSALKVVPQVNLDEFERRLRAAGAPAGAHEDPLAELARLVGLDVRAGRPAGDSGAAAPTRQASAARLPHIDEPINEPGGFDRLLRVNFGDEKPEAESAPSHVAVDEEASAQEPGPPVEAAPTVQPEAAEWAADAPPAPRRSGRVKLTMGVLIGLGAASFVAAWAAKGVPGLPKAPPIILAVSGPTKVQPPSQETVESPNDSASILLKDQTAKPGSVKLVSNEEQPVDLQQQTPPPASPAEAAAPSPIVGAPNPDKAVVSLATVAAAAPAAVPAPFPEPKRVKTVSVRPDGSLIADAAAQPAEAAPLPTRNIGPLAALSSDAAPASAAPAEAIPTASVPAAPIPVAAPPVDVAPAAETSGDLATPRPSDVPVPKARPSFGALANMAAAQPATPKLDLPAKPSAKSTARVPIAKIDTTVANASDQAPESPLQIVPNLLGSVARAVTGQPATQVAAADPVATSTTAVSAPTSAKADGSYAVQLGAPGSEQEAKTTSSRLQAKYSTELGGLEPAIHSAEVNGHSIYRIRVSGLSRADAVALCVKLKAAGGDAACFVAKN